MAPPLTRLCSAFSLSPDSALSLLPGGEAVRESLAASREHAGCTPEGYRKTGWRFLCQGMSVCAQQTSSKLKESRKGSCWVGMGLLRSTNPRNPRIWCVLIRNSLVDLRILSSSKLAQSCCFLKKGVRQTNIFLIEQVKSLLALQYASQQRNTSEQRNRHVFKVNSRCSSEYVLTSGLSARWHSQA